MTKSSLSLAFRRKHHSKLKILFLAFMLLSLPNLLKAQELSITDMTAYYFEQDWQKINIDLNSKGWKYDNTSVGEDEDTYTKIMSTYGKSNYTDVIRLYQLPETPSRVYFATMNVTAYNQIMKDLESHDFSLRDNKYGDSISSSFYENQLFELEISIWDQPRGLWYTFLLNWK